MKLWDVVKKVGSGIVSEVVPGGGAILNVVNELLPDDKKLPKNATGDQVRDAVESLPPEQAAAVMMKEFDVQIEEIRAWSDIQESLAKADASGASTRPEIARMMAWLVVFVVGVFTVAWAYTIFTDNSDTLQKLSDSWPLMVAVIGTPTALLRSYFGMRTKEKKARYSAASGQPVSEIQSLIGAFRK